MSWEQQEMEQRAEESIAALRGRRARLCDGWILAGDRRELMLSGGSLGRGRQWSSLHGRPAWRGRVVYSKGDLLVQRAESRHF